MEQRILIHTPIGKDAYHVCKIFEGANIEYFVCQTSAQVIQELDKGAAVLLMVEEALSGDFLKSITHYLQKQKAWSDLPILLLCKRGLDSPDLRAIYQRLGNVTIIERPLQIINLVTTVSSALRARKRQYEMREVDRRKDEFLAMLAHELRNPLAPISAASEILKIADLNRERTNRSSEIILRQVNHMTGLIDDLLDMSRVSRGLIEIENEIVNANDIASLAVEQVLPLINAKSHQLSVEPLSDQVYIKGDLKRLTQILTNLLNNAAKYTFDSGRINLKIEFTKHHVSFIVTDTGFGIAPNMLDSIFDMFTQAQRSSDRSQGGLGIGLALVKNLVELHEGSVTAQSAGLGHGSTFTVTLPRIENTHATSSELLKPIAQAPVMQRLLVVDDNVDAADTLSMYLETFGYEVLVENSAKAALERAITGKPDICLLDIGLPDMDGNELAKLIKANPATKSAILIAITGYGQEQDRKRTFESGFDYHFVKPVDVDLLMDTLKKTERYN
jgi:signal transduction histidine kinase/CheY-like chemotaxis protein